VSKRFFAVRNHLIIPICNGCERCVFKTRGQVYNLAKKKPFTYTVGDANDHNTFQGIAALVYRDPDMWVQIFEANRDRFNKPGIVPDLTRIQIPERNRKIPKLISKVMPVYPAGARQEKIWGEALLDISLREDGSVDRIDTIDGPSSELIGAATEAVKQWRYQPWSPGDKRGKFVVVISFRNNGKVQ
jgi:TonB family protein